MNSFSDETWLDEWQLSCSALSKFCMAYWLVYGKENQLKMTTVVLMYEILVED